MDLDRWESVDVRDSPLDVALLDIETAIAHFWTDPGEPRWIKVLVGFANPNRRKILDFLLDHPLVDGLAVSTHSVAVEVADPESLDGCKTT